MKICTIELKREYVIYFSTLLGIRQEAAQTISTQKMNSLQKQCCI